MIVVIGVSRMIRIASRMVGAMRMRRMIGDLRDRGRIQGARLIGRGEDHFGGKREEHSDHLVDGLVAHRSIDDPNRLACEELFDVSGQRPRACGVMRAIENDVGMGRDAFEPAGP